MGTRFGYPSIAGVGCLPLTANFQTQTTTTGAVRGSATDLVQCALRSTSTTDILNNVAVPGAWSGDPTSTSTTHSNTLTTLFLGGKTQLERALMANPTFVSIWIGNNDLLGPAISSGGTAASLATITSTAAFSTNYDAIVDPLVAARPGLKGVLIGVVDVGNAPIMFAASALGSAAFKGAFDAIACGAGTASTSCVAAATTLDASCTSAPGNAALINTFLAFQIRINAHPALIACTPGGASGLIPAPVGDALVLTTTEQATVTAAVTAFNTYISGKAAALGFAYYDPNPTLVTLKATGTLIRSTPSFAATGTFGTGMSLDGVHPNALVHLQIANDVIARINTKYSTKLPSVF
jgi:hypothetical protein